MNLILPQAPADSDDKLKNYAQEVKKSLQNLNDQISSASGSTSSSDLRGFKNPATFQNNTADATNDIDFLTAYMADTTFSTVISSGSTVTKQLDAPYAFGSGRGGLFSGAKAVSTWYSCWVGQLKDGTVDFGFDTTLTGSNAPATWQYKARVGWIYNQSTNIIIPFYQKERSFFYKAFQSDLGTATPSATRAAVTLTAPPNSLALFVGSLIASVAAIFIWIRESEFTDVTPAATAHNLYTDTAGTNSQAEFQVYVDSSRQLYYRSSTATATIFRILTKGFTDNI